MMPRQHPRTLTACAILSLACVAGCRPADCGPPGSARVECLLRNELRLQVETSDVHGRILEDSVRLRVRQSEVVPGLSYVEATFQDREISHGMAWANGLL